MEDGLLLLHVRGFLRGVAAGPVVLRPLDVARLDIGDARLCLLHHGLPREDEDLALGGVRGDVFRREEVKDEEDRGDRDQDAKVPPAVRLVEPISRRDVVRPLDVVQPGHGALRRADLLARRNVLVPGPAGDEARAGKVAAGHVVEDQGLETVVDGVQPAEPPDPDLHVGGRDGEARVQDHADDEDGGRGQGLVYAP